LLSPASSLSLFFSLMQLLPFEGPMTGQTDIQILGAYTPLLPPYRVCLKHMRKLHIEMLKVDSLNHIIGALYIHSLHSHSCPDAMRLSQTHMQIAYAQFDEIICFILRIE